MTSIDSETAEDVHASTVIGFAKALHVSMDYLVGLKAEEDGDREEETTTTLFSSRMESLDISKLLCCPLLEYLSYNYCSKKIVGGGVLMARVRIILADGREKIYHNAQIHQEKDGSLHVMREVEIIALDNVVEPDTDFPCNCIHETTLESETIAYFASGAYVYWETIETSA